MKAIAVIGSTGSIGEKVLEIVRLHSERFRVVALAARQNIEVLLKQAKEFRPKLICVFDKASAEKIKSPLTKLGVNLVAGEEGLGGADGQVAAPDHDHDAAGKPHEHRKESGHGAATPVRGV